LAREYIGRFAPSPTGPLHFGSLVAALASYLDARAQGGTWLVRMEDIDAPRVQPGAADDILRTLEAFGLKWDGPVMYQSTRIDAYRAALDQLRRAGHAYPCACSRREVADRYPGTCRGGLPDGKVGRAWRIRTHSEPICFDDEVQGRQCQNVEDYCGDFVVLRADGIFAYQLAVVVDDAEQRVTDVVRGADLLDSTARQIHLQRLQGTSQPRYLHTPVALNADGQKLSKQTLAPALNAADASRLLIAALGFLGQDTRAEGTARDVLDWAVKHWDVSAIPRLTGSISTPI
jgi:glutamyl-Q tRNA(Asp) synthetase